MDVLPMSELQGAKNERDLRRELAGAYRIFDYLGWTHLIFGHISVRVPGPQRHFLINPYGLRYDEVTASNLVKIDLDGNVVDAGEYPVNPAGFIIHGAIHEAREDAHCVMHTHTLAGMTFAATAARIRPIDFAGASLFGQVAYHEFAGVHADFSDRAALVRNLGDKNVMVMRNHGLLSCGATIASAFKRLHDLETACKVQCAAMSMHASIIEAPDHVAQTHADAIAAGDGGALAFNALLRLMEKRDPTFLD